MEFEYKNKKIVFKRELSSIDDLVIRFTKILDIVGIKYVIISGYVSILFGRSRSTEDIGLFVEKIDIKKFNKFWKELNNANFYCLITSNIDEAYNKYLKDMIPLRFAQKDSFIPNFEIKFPKTKYNHYALDNKLEIILNKEKIWISELELQIAFKLYLGSEKDFEDARHIYMLFKEKLNKDLLNNHIQELNVKKEAEMIL